MSLEERHETGSTRPVSKDGSTQSTGTVEIHSPFHSEMLMQQRSTGTLRHTRGIRIACSPSLSDDKY